MNLPSFSVRHSLFVNLLSAGLFIAGIVIFPRMPREAFPNVDFDIVTIQTVYPGATAQEIEKLITIPIEDEIREVDGIDKVNSVSVEGLSMIVVQLETELDNPDRAVTDVQRAVDRVADLPRDADDPLVEELRSHDYPVLTLALMGEDIWELRRVARELEEWIEEVPGVARVDRPGWRETEVWVEVDPEKLMSYHLSLDEVIRALRARNANIPGGKFYVEERQHLIRTLGEFETPEEIAEVVVRANDQGNWLRVADVADVRYALEEKDQIDKTNARRSVNLLVIKKAGEDILRTLERVKRSVEEYRPNIPASVSVLELEELPVKYVKRRLGILLNNAGVGTVLVIGVLLLFLNRRMALLTALGIPLSFCITAIIMQSSDVTINLLTMFGMIIVLGMVVDDAIVIAENAFRYIEKGVPPREAAVRGASEVIRPVSATILTSVASFGPLMFMGGIMGKFIWVIPAVVVFTLLASLFESVVILPSHIADFVKPEQARDTKQSARWFTRLRRFYLKSLKQALRWRWAVLGGMFAMLALSIALVISPIIKLQLFPTTGVEIFFIRFQAPVGASLEEVNELIRPVEEAVLRLPEHELDYFTTMIGVQQEDSTEPPTQRGTHVGQVQVYLVSDESKRRKAPEVIEALREEVGDIKGLEVSFESVRAGPPVGKPVDVAVRGDNFAKLEAIAEEFKAYLKTVPGVEDIEDDYRPGKPEFRVEVDERAAMRAGVSVQSVGEAMRAAYAGGVATTIKRTDEEIDVLVRLPEGARYDPASLQALVVENPQGDLVPLTRIARFTTGPGVTDIKHVDYQRAIRVTAQVDEEVTSSHEVNRALMKRFDDVPQRHPGYTLRYGGEQEDTMESLNNLFRAMVLALLAVYGILAVALDSLTLPVLVMLPIPFGLIGVVIAFLIHGLPLSFMALLGIVGLSGVVVNDSIVLVDFIRQRNKRHHVLRAVMEGAKVRLRPVLLTTLTTAVGLLPVAYGLGGLDPFVQPAALALGWGLVFATFLTLILIPSIYAFAAGTRGLRLGAWLIDGALLIAPTVFLALFTIRAFAVIYVLGMVGLQAFLLVTRGQSIGKRNLGLRIVDAQTGGPVPPFRVLVARTLVPGLLHLAILPLLADGVSLFRRDARALHDRAAGTRVVRTNEATRDK